MIRIKSLLTSIIIIVQSLIELARNDPEFAEAVRGKILKVVPEKYKEEADVLIKRVLNIKAQTIDIRQYNGRYPGRNRPRNKTH